MRRGPVISFSHNRFETHIVAMETKKHVNINNMMKLFRVSFMLDERLTPKIVYCSLP